MKKKLKALAIGMSLTCFLTACSSAGKSSSSSDVGASKDSADSSTSSQATMEPTTINIRIMNAFTNLDKILEVYYDKVKDDPILSKITLNFSYVTGADYIDKLSLAISAQEDYDLMFCGSWQGLNNYIQQGAFKDVLSYFNDDRFPGLKTAFPKEFLNAAKTGDALYSIPVAENFEDLRGVLYREDLRKKYNLPEITDLTTFRQYLDKMQEVKEKEGLVKVWSLTGQGFMTFLNPRFEAAQHHVYNIDAASNFFIALNEDDTKVIDAYVAGDDEEHYANFPAPYNKDFIAEYYAQLPEWLQYCNDDAATNKDAGSDCGLTIGLSAVTYSPLSLYSSTLNDLQQNVPNAELGFYIFDDDQRNFVKGAIVNGMMSNNFLVVPAWSKKTDAVMYFLNWLMSSRENHDLFQYGIEGVHWKAIGDNAVEIPTLAEDVKYTFPGYTMTWNPTYIRYNSKVLENDKIKAMYDYEYSKEAYTLSPLSGFYFDTTKIKTEVAAVKAVFSAAKFAYGAYGDKTIEMAKKFNADARAAGLDTIRAELIKQVQAFLDSKK